MKHLKKFSTNTDRIAYESSDDYIEPYVSLVGQNSSVHYNRVPPNYLRFTALENGSTLQLKKYDAYSGEYLTPTVNLEYSHDGFNFTTYDYSKITLSKRQTIYLRGNNSNGFTTYNDDDDPTYYYFVTPEGSFECHGNIMSLLYGANFETSPNALVIPNDWCYYRLFTDSENEIGCNITTAPELPATLLTDCCYREMFYYCTNLVNAPELPATVLTPYCYTSMFYGCTSLTTAPELPAITLKSSCYSNMFNGCTNLTVAPELSATTLENSCYNNMFYGCTSLTTAPKLPATTLKSSCYAYMFRDCTSLQKAPVLPATTLVSNCYYRMFENCTNLNSITCFATNISATYCTNGWVKGVSTAGTFIKHPSMEDWGIGNDGIPTDWTTTDAVPENYLTFNILSDGIINWKISTESTTVKTISYSINDGEWTNITSSKTGTSFNVSTGDKVRFKGNNYTYATSVNNYNTFNGSTASFDLEGNIMSLVDEVLFDYIATLNIDYTFSHLFYRTNVIRANNLVLPAITLSKYCYANIFGYCSLLTVAPILPATTLAKACYNCMFYNCTNLTATLVLPATTLAESCYTYMFYNCTSLTSVPELPATVLVKFCYEFMFYGCTSLNYIKAMFTTTPNDTYTNNWVKNVASSGTFVKNAAATWDVIGEYGIPEGWTVETE